MDAYQPNQTKIDNNVVFYFPGTMHVNVMDDSGENKAKFMSNVQLGDKSWLILRKNTNVSICLVITIL